MPPAETALPSEVAAFGIFDLSALAVLTDAERNQWICGLDATVRAGSQP
jgi:hypothetical protein